MTNNVVDLDAFRNKRYREERTASGTEALRKYEELFSRQGTFAGGLLATACAVLQVDATAHESSGFVKRYAMAEPIINPITHQFQGAHLLLSLRMNFEASATRRGIVLPALGGKPHLTITESTVDAMAQVGTPIPEEILATKVDAFLGNDTGEDKQYMTDLGLRAFTGVMYALFSLYPTVHVYEYDPSGEVDQLTFLLRIENSPRLPVEITLNRAGMREDKALIEWYLEHVSPLP